MSIAENAYNKKDNSWQFFVYISLK